MENSEENPILQASGKFVRDEGHVHSHSFLRHIDDDAACFLDGGVGSALLLLTLRLLSAVHCCCMLCRYIGTIIYIYQVYMALT